MLEAKENQRRLPKTLPPGLCRHFHDKEKRQRFLPNLRASMLPDCLSFTPLSIPMGNSRICRSAKARMLNGAYKCQLEHAGKMGHFAPPNSMATASQRRSCWAFRSDSLWNRNSVGNKAGLTDRN